MSRITFFLFLGLVIPKYSMSAQICGFDVIEGFGSESVNYVYYQIDNFPEKYQEIQFKAYMSNDDCWKDVENLLKDTEFIKEYGFSKNGAPSSFQEWYSDWYNGIFLNNFPGAIRSRFEQLEFQPSLGRDI